MNSLVSHVEGYTLLFVHVDADPSVAICHELVEQSCVTEAGLGVLVVAVDVEHTSTRLHSTSLKNLLQQPSAVSKRLRAPIFSLLSHTLGYTLSLVHVFLAPML
jgi:hypothetical protein